VILTGAHVTLRPAHEADVDALTSMFEEPEVARWWCRYDRARVEAEVLHEDDPTITVYVLDVDGEVTGLIQSTEEPEPDYRHASIDIAVATRWHGRGIAVDAIRTLAADLLGRQGHHHLTIDPAAANERAIACYRKVGFRPVGILRANERGDDGAFRDALLMDLVAGELT